MIIEIEHVKNGEIIIQVNEKEKYFASKTWKNMKLDSRNYLITTIDEKLLYYTNSLKLHRYILFDDNNILKGKINKKTIELENHKYFCHEKATGLLDNISIYDNDKQIAQVVFPQNNGKYYIFLLPQYENLDAVISLYSILCYNFSLWDTVDERVSYPSGFKYTYSKDDKYYNKDWITNNFDKTKVDNIYNEINRDRTIAKESYLNYSKKLLLFLGLAWLLIFIIVLILNFAFK